jgi:hypothetical protein
VIVQNIKSMQKPLARAFIPLIISGTDSGVGASSEAIRAIIIKSGAPGG